MTSLEERIDSGSWTIGVIGLGYVGLPLAVTMVQNGLQAIGYDRSPQRVELLQRIIVERLCTRRYLPVICAAVQCYSMGSQK